MLSDLANAHMADWAARTVAYAVLLACLASELVNLLHADSPAGAYCFVLWLTSIRFAADSEKCLVVSSKEKWHV